MFYSNNNDNYMQDFYFYNQTPNNTYFPNNMINNMPNANNAPWQNMMGPNMYNQNASANQIRQNPNNLYPDTYKIISPVVSKVIANSNYQFLNEEALNNMTDTVFNIVESQIDYEKNSSQSLENAQTNSQSSNNSSNATMSKVSDGRSSQTSNSRPNKNDNLLKDIIKILILKEILSRPNCSASYYPYYNQMGYSQNF